jgi:hypothetical protein
MNSDIAETQDISNEIHSKQLKEGAAVLMLPLQDQSEWQIEWQNRACEGLCGLASAGVGSCFGWSTGLTCGNRTLRGFMVRRRSTVRFRKGAPRGLHVCVGTIFTFGSDITACR